MTYLRLRSVVLTMTVCAPLACGDDVGAEGPGSEDSTGSSSSGESSSGGPADSSSGGPTSSESSTGDASSSDGSSSDGSSSDDGSTGSSSDGGSSSSSADGSSSESSSDDAAASSSESVSITSAGEASEATSETSPLDCACMAGEYCDWSDEMCGEGIAGVCTPLPDSCDDILAPVCGCDGEDYPNECEAAALGVDVAYDGMCAVVDTCDCVAGEYCEVPVGQCVGEDGVCVEMPFACNELYAPVCGCDGVTYSNECFAAGAGVNIDYDGVC